MKMAIRNGMMVSKIQNKKLKKEEITIWRFVRQSVYDDDNIRQIEFSLFLSRMEDGAKTKRSLVQSLEII